jgi:hypothetical protein
MTFQNLANQSEKSRLNVLWIQASHAVELNTWGGARGPGAGWG